MSSADSQQEKENAPGVLTNFPNINSNDDNSEAGNKTRPLVETDQAEIMVIPASSSSPSLAGQEETGVNQSLGQAGLESSDINSSYHNLTRKLVKLKGFLVDQTSRINMQHQINERMFVTKDDYRCGVFDVYGIGNSDHDLQLKDDFLRRVSRLNLTMNAWNYGQTMRVRTV
ncbi:uncharacterized protein L201_007609 [Kwoniella dendrophila CBS 6074]|uniref:Uncharacterized protein n=1 Tax=Kwoniella dendrophila CBS 6074 TaxID=1295534 RepID=A0AAX4K4X3_9TREE